MGPLKIVNIDHISPPVGPFPSPGDTIPLSFFDTLFVTAPPVQLLILYPTFSDDSIPVLKSSLSKTLLNFHSLAGNIAYINGDIIIDCGRKTNKGVAFIEAECDEMSIEKLANDTVHNMDAFEKLVPCIDADRLPMCVLKVQVTMFLSGGVGVGITFNHLATDGNGIWRFIHEWSSCCKGCKGVGEGVGLIIDRKLVNCRTGSEVVARKFVQELKPDFLNFLCETKITSAPVQAHPPQLAGRTFNITAAKIENIRQYIVNKTSDAFFLENPPSKFAILTSFIWVCFAKAKATSYEGTSKMGFAMETRSYLDPPIPENYMGNCLKPLYAKINCSELLSENGLVNACIEIIRTVKEGKHDPLKGHEEWVKDLTRNPPCMKFRVIGSPKFTAYDLADFGWGRPERVEYVSMRSEGCVNYYCGKQNGRVQVSVVLSSLCMGKFVDEFEKF